MRKKNALMVCASGCASFSPVLRSAVHQPLLPASEKAHWKDLIERHYDLAVRSVELAWQGANITLKVDSDADSFFLRLYREKGRTRTKIDAEIGALLAFRLAGQTHVSVPVQLRDKRFSILCPLMHT
jgi:hypothetical protein